MTETPPFVERVVEGEPIDASYCNLRADVYDGPLSLLVDRVLTTLVAEAADLPVEGPTREGLVAWLTERVQDDPGGLGGLTRALGRTTR